MKKFLVASIFGAFLVAACTTAQVQQAETSIQKFTTQVCPQLITDGTVLATFQFSDPTIQPKIVKINADVALVCSKLTKFASAGSAGLDASSFQNLANSALPILVSAVEDSGLPAAQQNAIKADLLIANTIINQVINDLKNVTPASKQ